MNTTPVSEYDDNEIVNPSSNTHIDTLLAARLSRRHTLKGGIGATTAALLAGVGLPACGGSNDDAPAPAAPPAPEPRSLNFAAVAKTRADQVTVPAGYQRPYTWSVLSSRRRHSSSRGRRRCSARKATVAGRR